MRWPIEVDSVYGCWLWTGPADDRGYPVVGNTREWAHRHVWAHSRGALASGMELDHLCRRRRCVRPTHLEPVKQAANKRRMTWRHRSQMDRCPAGHSYYQHGRLTPEGGRVCRECDRVETL